MGPDPADIDAVLAANLSFYHAFGSLQIEGMDRVWDHSDRVLCIHPGWRVLAGWEQVRNSWESIFHNTSLMHFTITDAQVVVHGGLCVGLLRGEHHQRRRRQGQQLRRPGDQRVRPGGG